MRRTNSTQNEKWNLGRLFAPSTALEEDLELEEEVPVEEEVEEDGKIAEEEQEERGRSVSSTWNYLVYLRACGVSLGLSYLLCALSGQGERLLLRVHHYFTLSSKLFFKSSLRYHECSFSHWYANIVNSLES